MKVNDTICACATLPGTGAIAIIRVSGDDSLAIADKVVTLRKGVLADVASNSVRFGTVEGLDDVLVSVFRNPHSYTGEDSVEISCHASSYIVEQILFRLVENGARPAGPGEFTQRAFVNGKMDLSQAEAVADMIAAEDASAHRLALNQLKGGVSNEIAEMRGQLLDMTSLMELELDFSEEDVEFADRSQLSSLLEEVSAHVKRLKESFRLGNALKNGVPVCIAGAANTGKSTLLNALLQEERAIVSPIAGTTRDSIEETFVIGGIRFRFIDTAGLRETDDTVESMGIERSMDKIAKADIVIAVVDCQSSSSDVRSQLSLIRERMNGSQNLVVFVNKVDIVSGAVELSSVPSDSEHSDSVLKDTAAIIKEMIPDGTPIIYGSAKNGLGIDDLKNKLEQIQKDRVSASRSGDTMVSNVRHYNALCSAWEALKLVRAGLDSGISTELVARDLRDVLFHLGSITGDITTDEVLGNIFKKFCIGK
ncbi:MAG: tRNA uridine-5-carboxymethylaminomethyl(34) synthesis GTPase MnmE [Bacteroidales bacterium]|nr:tRNA uridine-5-carboxymethylaminomethyl(34) synthesis GTPase MnmE [Bacteroidales bacterium]